MIIYNDSPREYLSWVFFFGVGFQIVCSLILSVTLISVTVSCWPVDPTVVFATIFSIAMLATSLMLLKRCSKSAFKVFVFLSLADIVI